MPVSIRLFMRKKWQSRCNARCFRFKRCRWRSSVLPVDIAEQLSDIYDANGTNPLIELPIGIHTFQLIVNDGNTDSAPDDVNITVLPPPVAEAGADKTLYGWIDGKAGVDLDGSGSSDIAAADLTYKWMWTVDGILHESVMPGLQLSCLSACLQFN